MSDKKSDHVGVVWHKGKGKWMAYIGRAGKQKYLGVFDNVEDAIAAREKAELEFPLPHRKRKKSKIEYDPQEKLHYANTDMSNLSEIQRVCLLDYINGIRVKDIASKYKISEAAVYVKIKEAKRIIDTGAAYSPEELKDRKEYYKKYYAEHREEMKDSSVKYAKDHPESVRKYRKRYYDENRDRLVNNMKSYNKEYYEKNRERLIAKARARRMPMIPTSEIEREILDEYRRLGSVNAVVAKTHHSWNRVVKSLSNCGVVINDTHRIILNLHKKGMSAREIAEKLGLNFKKVQSYLPRVRPVYGENRSENAERIKEWRERNQ